jgi:flagellin
LSSLLDDMGQSVNTIKAADDGITAITKLVESAKAKANQALQTQAVSTSGNNSRRSTMNCSSKLKILLGDSSYKGKNLLAGAGNDLRTHFNEDSTSRLDISAVDYTDTTLSTGLNLTDLVEGTGGATAFNLLGGKLQPSPSPVPMVL